MKRIAILGFALESNAFAPPCGRADFEQRGYYRGADITAQARAEHPAIYSGICGFYAEMDRRHGPAGWQPVPIVHAASQPAGPVEEGFFRELLGEFEAGLQAAGRLDGVYVAEHGGATATHTHDPDGEVFALVRRLVGPDVPVVATLDLHANVSDAMMNSVDILVGYRTNPHVDIFERGEEAARLLEELMAGTRATAYRVRLPLVGPSVTLLTAEGHPYGDLIRLGQSRIDERVMNVTILAGFAFADTPKNGMTVIVTTRDDPALARSLAIELASAGWNDRQRYVPRMIPLDEAVEQARAVGADPMAPSLLFADPADNPGGGGRGNTTYILAAFLKAGVHGCIAGVFFDPALVEQARRAGEGARFRADLNTRESARFSEPLSWDARVVHLHDGRFVGHHGMVEGKTVDLGPSAVIALDGITLVVISKRQQCLSTDFFEALGVDVAGARSIVVKSRGHFRAGFQHLFPPERIREVDVPGLTSPNLANFDWRGLPRPVFPLDPEAGWTPPA
ncbi:microcystinase C [Thalassobaculum fulvum]|uniref:Microcystinase C n=1 Tax=Thalassobaculum fulvum TaxID=1633335 RepID=A0A918XQB6_9PROT|nr:M81 family metallopeptidase [Thalassobaculum fulvum]GHD46713.1 microcystinase C [Thalassobaculum fulvum]